MKEIECSRGKNVNKTPNMLAGVKIQRSGVKDGKLAESSPQMSAGNHS